MTGTMCLTRSHFDMLQRSPIMASTCRTNSKVLHFFDVRDAVIYLHMFIYYFSALRAVLLTQCLCCLGCKTLL